MNGDNNRYISVPINDLHFWYYFDEKCFELASDFQKRKKIETDELNKKYLEYQKANIDAIIKDNIEPIKKLIEKEPEPIIVEPEKEKLELNAEITIPVSKPEVIKPIINKKAPTKTKKNNDDSGQVGLF